MLRQKKIILFSILILVLIVLFIGAYLYLQSKKITEVAEPTVTRETILKELTEFVPPEDTKLSREEILEQLENFEINEDDLPSREEILDSLNDPNIKPLPVE